MKIVKVEIRHLRVPFKKPYITADHGEGRECEEILVLVHTDEGIIGLGETETYSMFGYSVDMTISALKNVLAPAIIGMDPTNIQAINDKMDQVLRWAHPIKCPIDIACWDILGKAMNSRFTSCSVVKSESMASPLGQSEQPLRKQPEKRHCGQKNRATQWLALRQDQRQIIETIWNVWPLYVMPAALILTS